VAEVKRSAEHPVDLGRGAAQAIEDRRGTITPLA
jgi:hypothetical protein